VVLIGAVSGVAGGVFCWLLLNTHRWMPSSVRAWRSNRPVAFGAACGLVIAVIGVASGGHTFGSGYAEARAMLEGRAQLGAAYPVLKMASMVGSYLPGAPGGLFAPSLAIGAGIGNALHLLFGQMQLPMLIALGMVGYLAAVTQSPITAFVIVIEMINGHALVISLMATALIASQVSKLFAPALYEALSERYSRPHVAPEVVSPAPTGESSSGRLPGQF
jgi:H+/Cl- antiporter ClcA